MPPVPASVGSLRQRTATPTFFVPGQAGIFRSGSGRNRTPFGPIQKDRRPKNQKQRPSMPSQ
eukprot:scaffold3970_cov125-Skeletonema_marinoi.AAC.1